MLHRVVWFTPETSVKYVTGNRTKHPRNSQFHNILLFKLKFCTNNAVASCPVMLCCNACYRDVGNSVSPSLIICAYYPCFSCQTVTVTVLCKLNTAALHVCLPLSLRNVCDAQYGNYRDLISKGTIAENRTTETLLARRSLTLSLINKLLINNVLSFIIRRTNNFRLLQEHCKSIHEAETFLVS